MKKLFDPKAKIVTILLATLLITGLSNNGFSQGMLISASAGTADGSAMLDIVSTNRGLLAPRMTAAQRNAISAPAPGLLIYNTDTNAFNYYSGGWTALGTGTGNGTVTNFSAGTLSPLFTTSVATATTTPSLSFSLSNAGSYTILGNNTGSPAGPSYFIPLLASALFSNQGTTATVLHGNAAGSPSWGAIALGSDVSGTLPVLNGGTGVSTLTGLVKGNGTAAFTAASAGTDYIAPNTSITAGTNTKITYDAEGLVIAGNQASASDLSDGTTGTGSLVLSNSPTLTGAPILPAGTIATTQALNDNSTALATTAFVDAAIPVYSFVTGSNVTTSSTSLTDIAGLSFTAVSGAKYEFEAVLSVGTTNVTTGTGYGVNYSVAGSSIEAQITGYKTATTSMTLRISAFNSPASGFLAVSNALGGVIIKGVIVTASAGNLTIRHLKTTSGTSTVYVNSFLKVTRVL
jgi:hypothetical protein